MKKLAFISLIALLAIFSPACGKKGGGDGPCTETGLAFVSNPPAGSFQTPSAGPNFPLTVNVSNMPAAGVTITITARPEASGAPFFTETRTSSQAANSFTITNTPVNVASLVEIKLVSKSCETNTASGSYRYSRK